MINDCLTGKMDYMLWWHIEIDSKDPSANLGLGLAF
jgi:hypothetical protein